ncbi:hypothetical protein Lal_00017046 [Lupinus albus]|uniref:Putative histone-lysine N-methyltransferase chromatin regulator PHD family n=1 Tax=Lupinus albus TaxID=3870 RepID=A0A6A5P2G5_LUPAL|nr:putative histone-lysine N-methyltransferase chromatin regulator PHD family [Lupinus albus]KAF1891412.1 hypothetical protein Lal_00017046 [Lupinus albus]
MSSSDEEDEAQPLSVLNYYFEDDKDAPVSFSVLPVQWNESESSVGKKKQLFLRGVADDGLRKIFMEVVAWRFDLSYVKPTISVLPKNKKWIKLEKPRKSYEDTIRTILITIYFLGHVKRNPDTSAKSLWDNLSRNKEFSSYEVMPSHNDLLNHKALMGEAAKRDAVLAKSKLLHMVLEDKLGSKKLSDEEAKDLARPGFIIDDIENDITDEIAEESDEEDELFDSVCAICDNGGNLLCCDGKCMRSFHAVKEDGEESSCESLGFSQKKVDEIQNFYCENCKYNQHQCFACGKLGCSDKFSGAEVFKCASATCGLFYHPHCVAKLIQDVAENAPMELERNIAQGVPFTCPTHYCHVCKEMEDKKKRELQFAVCRRCPMSYHRKCLPRDITLDGIDEDIITRAWEGLLPNNRILIYCLDHEIDDDLETPLRDHIKFPVFKAKVGEINNEKTKPATKERVTLKKNNVDLDNSFGRRTADIVSKLSRKMSSEKGVMKFEKISESNIPRKPKTNEASKRWSNENKMSISKGIERPVCDDKLPSLGEKLYDAFFQKDSEKINSGNDKIANAANKMTYCASPALDADSEQRLMALFKDATSTITLENVVKDHKFSSTHTSSLRSVVEKTITVGRLEGSVEAVRTALKMLENGCSIRDAEAVCGPDVLNQIFKWKDKLRVYLAPVLYGNRYTSYGRHFTQVEKLEGIVDKLHWYVQNGDTIVDFCCGANDFSILMKKKLEETGKSCLYRNYDLLPTKNDFNFEMRDWTTVQPKELPRGSQLIMGLNPPFGLKAALANKFIDKALEFKPKLLILIVPPETERLDKKQSPYDLVWEDDRFLSGKSFYLPGSVDTNDKQMEQWNVKPPPLSLWSRPDWIDAHKAIAQKHGHLLSQREALKMESFNNERLPASRAMDDVDNLSLGNDLKSKKDQASMNEGQKRCSSVGNVGRQRQERQECRMSKAESTSRKRKQTQESDGRGPGVTLPARRQVVNQMPEEVPDSPFDPINGRSSAEGFQPKSVISPSYVEVGDHGHGHLEPIYSSDMEYGAAYGETHNWPRVANPLSGIKEHHGSLRGDSIDSRGYRENGVQYLSELETRQRTPHYGHQDYPHPMSAMRNNYLSGHDAAHVHMRPSYGGSGSVSESYMMMNTPAMQRYAPRLDELNHAGMDSLGYGPPIVGRNGTFTGSVPQPGFGSGNFAAAPNHAYSRQNSAGWLDE